MKTSVIDLSTYNTIPESLKPAREAGVLGVIHRFVRSNGQLDGDATARHYLATEAGLLWGLYGFPTSGSVTEQAARWRRAAKDRDLFDDNTLIAVDYEEVNGVLPCSIEELADFVEALMGEFGRTIVLYTRKNLMPATPNPVLTGCRLWLADYTSPYPVPPGWPKYWLLQWTDKGTVPGVAPPTDCNQFDGSDEALRAEWSGREVVPPEELVVKVIAPQGVRVEVEYR